MWEDNKDNIEKLDFENDFKNVSESSTCLFPSEMLQWPCKSQLMWRKLF